MATSQSTSASCAASANSFDITSTAKARANGAPVADRAKDQVLADYPNAYARAGSDGAGFVVWVCDYAAGYGLTVNAAWYDALHVLNNDLLTHKRLASVN